MNKKLIIWSLAFFFLIFISIDLVMAAWTLTSCTIDSPTSNSNINVDGTFTIQATGDLSGSASGACDIDFYFEYNNTATTNTSISTSVGAIPMNVSTLNPDTQLAAACKANCQTAAHTAFGNKKGNFKVSVRCDATTCGSLRTNYRVVTINDPNPRFYFNNTNNTSPEINTAVSHNINWTDNKSLSMNFFETNITGTVKNWTTTLSGTSQHVNMTNITSNSAGRYYWKSYTNDSSNNWNQTIRMLVTVTAATDSCTPPGSGDWIITDTCFKSNENINLASGGRVLILAGGLLICDRANVTAAGQTPIMIILGQNLKKLISNGASNC